CSGVWMSGRETCLCRFDWSFLTCGTESWRFYCETGSPQSSFKQNGQT
ncbi:hypothetical protein A2U01_0101217, partial [Trifolium medium]|nr:hypothetical protein [Trifolium medium]